MVKRDEEFMKFKNFISKRSLANFLMKFRIKTDHSTIISFSALVLILFIAFVIRLFPLRWEIQTGSIHLSEFDPYFQYRFTEYIVKNGFISWAWPNQWVDMNRWYPDGINVARYGYVGLPFTAAFLYNIIFALGVSIKLIDFCALFPAVMGMLTCFAIYFLGKDIGGKSVGLLASLFLALSPSYIQRTSFGFFDDETIGILALVLFAFLFLRANEEGRQLKSTIIYSFVSGLFSSSRPLRRKDSSHSRCRSCAELPVPGSRWVLRPRRSCQNLPLMPATDSATASQTMVSAPCSGVRSPRRVSR